jgi:hypothetical protein
MRISSAFFRRRGKLLVGLLLVAALSATSRSATRQEIEERMRQDLKYLASEELEGRGIYTKGLEKAASYIAGRFMNAGLKPGGVDGTYFQPFTVSAGAAKLEPGSKLILTGPQGQKIELAENQQFVVMATSGSGKINGAPVVFAGYGATAPDVAYDDFEGIDANGKVVIVVRRVPRWDNKEVPFDGDRKESHASILSKVANVETHRAAAVILVNDHSERGDKLESFADAAKGYSTSSIPTLHVKRHVVDQMLVSSVGSGLAEIEKAIDRNLKPRSAVLPGWKATVHTSVSRKTADVKNVVGVVPGAGPLAKEIVVIGAHYDHLGLGESGSAAKSAEDKKKIHFGADDNASGTTAVLELARRFGEMKNRQGRTLVFMLYSAEEKGLLGSRHYVNRDPLFPLADTVAMVNLDMVGRMAKDKDTGKGKLNVEGVGSAKGFEDMIETLNTKYDFHLVKKKGSGPYSDHDPFYKKKIPVVFLWTGIHTDYHQPTDTWDKINLSDMMRITDLAEEVISTLATNEHRPEYVYVPSPVMTFGGGPKMGLLIDYGSDKKGVLLEGVSPEGPAAKAGLKAGDLIISIADRPVTNVTTYMEIMRQQKPGQTLPVIVERGGKKVTVQVTPK